MVLGETGKAACSLRRQARGRTLEKPLFPLLGDSQPLQVIEIHFKVKELKDILTFYSKETRRNEIPLRVSCPPGDFTA